ncbi:MAG TPA: phage major capsid protein [Phycisphaerae bacterium]|nr:phage major capsid protein [Phycisphaerae bacterium]
MEKFFKLFGAMVALLAVSTEQRDEKELAAALKGVDDFLASDEAKELRQFGEIKAGVDQLRVDLDAQAELVRQVDRRTIVAPMGMAFSPRPDGRIMRFSHPDLSRGFADFCIKVRKRDKDLTPVDDEQGGYTIPDEYQPDIVRMIESVGIVAQLGRPIPLGAGTRHIARRLGGADFYFKAAGTAGTESTPTFGMLDMAPETLIGLIDVDMELDEDAMVNLGDYLASEFAYGAARKEDQMAFVGTGSPADGGITGILNSDRVTIVDMAGTKDAFADLAYDDLVELEANVWDGAQANARYLMHRTILALIKKLKDTANMPIWQPPAAQEPSTMNGYPYSLSGLMRGTAATAVSTTFLAFGDFAQGLYLGRRGQLRIDFSDAVGFKNYQRCWRAIERVDIAVMGFTAAEITAHPELANPISVLKTAAS